MMTNSNYINIGRIELSISNLPDKTIYDMKTYANRKIWHIISMTFNIDTLFSFLYNMNNATKIIQASANYKRVMETTMSASEAANAIGCSPSTIKRRLGPAYCWTCATWEARNKKHRGHYVFYNKSEVFKLKVNSKGAKNNRLKRLL